MRPIELIIVGAMFLFFIAGAIFVVAMFGRIFLKTMREPIAASRGVMLNCPCCAAEIPAVDETCPSCGKQIR